MDSHLLQNFDISALMKRLSLDGLPTEEQERFKEKIAGLLEARVIAAIQDYLTDGELWEIEKLADDQVVAYIKGKGVNIEAIAFEQGAMLREELIESMGYLSGKIDEMKKEK